MAFFSTFLRLVSDRVISTLLSLRPAARDARQATAAPLAADRPILGATLAPRAPAGVAMERMLGMGAAQAARLIERVSLWHGPYADH